MQNGGEASDLAILKALLTERFDKLDAVTESFGARFLAVEKALEAAHKELHALRLSVSGTREAKDATQDPPAVDGERSANARVPFANLTHGVQESKPFSSILLAGLNNANPGGPQEVSGEGNDAKEGLMRAQSGEEAQRGDKVLREYIGPNTPSPITRPVMVSQKEEGGPSQQEVQFEMVMQTGEPQRNAIPNVPLRSPQSPFVEMQDLWRLAQQADSKQKKSWADQRSPGPSPGPVFLHPYKQNSRQQGMDALSRPGSMEGAFSFRTASIEVGVGGAFPEEDKLSDIAETPLPPTRPVEATPEPPPAMWAHSAAVAQQVLLAQQQQQQQPFRFQHTCKHWKMGQCRLGTACKFQHPPREELERRKERQQQKKRLKGGPEKAEKVGNAAGLLKAA
jgi:hypothetical protein